MNSLEDIWNVLMQNLSTQLTPTAISTWFSDCRPVELEEYRLVIRTTTQFKKKIISERFSSAIKSSLSELFSSDFELLVLVGEEEYNRDEDLKEDDPLPEMAGYTFDNFIVGNSNKFAHAAAKAVAENPGKNYNPLFIFGNSGLGKTHLLMAIGHDIHESFPNKKISYIKGDDFTNEIVKYIREGKTLEFRDKYRNVDLFLVDDIQFIAGKQSTQEEFFHTFNSIYEAGNQIVITSDRPPKEMATLEERLRNRFESGLIADIQPPDLETRIAIVKSKAKSLNIELPDQVCLFIAEKIKNTIRQLEGAVKNMQALMELHGAEANMATAQLAIRDIFNESDPTPILIEKIIDEVSRTYGVSVADIKSRKHDAKFTTPRHIAMYVIREMTELTNQKIADYFGLNDHTSVLYAVRKVKNEREKNYTMKTIIADIIKNVQNS